MICTFAALLEESTSEKEFWRGGRVVDCGGLENRCTERYPGFESLSLRKNNKVEKKIQIYLRFLFYLFFLARMPAAALGMIRKFMTLMTPVFFSFIWKK